MQNAAFAHLGLDAAPPGAAQTRSGSPRRWPARTPPRVPGAERHGAAQQAALALRRTVDPTATDGEHPAARPRAGGFNTDAPARPQALGGGGSPAARARSSPARAARPGRRPGRSCAWGGAPHRGGAPRRPASSRWRHSRHGRRRAHPAGRAVGRAAAEAAAADVPWNGTCRPPATPAVLPGSRAGCRGQLRRRLPRCPRRDRPSPTRRGTPGREARHRRKQLLVRQGALAFTPLGPGGPPRRP